MPVHTSSLVGAAARALLGAAAGAALSAMATTAAAAVYYDDPMVDPGFPGRGSQGGSFDAEGWSTTGPTDAVWYEVADALPSGSVEFSLKGASVGGSLNGADHDIFAMYQAPTGQPEPIEYSPYFRNNDFKVFTRVFGDKEPDRGGAMKIEFILCPRGEPWHHDEPCAPDCGVGALAYANGQPKDIGWDPAVWYRIGITWGNGKAAFSRDGVQLADVSYPGTYAPQPMRVRIGSPRHGVSDVAYMPMGLTFKDVLIQGEPGAMTPVCGAQVDPDAGTPEDAGVGDEDAGTAGELAAIQDVTAAAWAPDVVFEDPADLNVEGGDGGQPQAVVYLRFPKPAGTVTQAVLRLRAHAYGSAKGGSGVIHAVSDPTWTESTLTWANKPAWGDTAYGVAQSVDPDLDVQWDVTELVAQGITDFALVSSDADGAHFVSKEAGGAEKGPRLYIEAQPARPGPDGGGSGGSGGEGSGAAGGSGASDPGGGASGGFGPGIDGNPADETSSGDSGCGCRTSGRAAGAPYAALAGAALAGAALFAVRRRARRCVASAPLYSPDETAGSST